MSGAKLEEAFRGARLLVEGKRVSLWITPDAERQIGALAPSDLVAVTVSAFTISAGQLGRWSEPQSIGHSEAPELRFTGTRLKRDLPYYFVAHTFNDPTNWLRLMTDAFLEAKSA